MTTTHSRGSQLPPVPSSLLSGKLLVVNDSRSLSTVVLTIFSLLALSACSHIKVVAFDKRQNTVTIQGGKWASDSNYQEAAEEYCKGPATLVAMDETTVGSYTVAQTQTYGNTTYA